MIGLIRGFIREILSFFILYFVFFFFNSFDKEIVNSFSFISNVFLKISIIFLIMGVTILFLESIVLYSLNDFFIKMKFFNLNNFILGFIFGFLRGIALIFYCVIFLSKTLHLNNYFYYQTSFFIPIFIKFLFSIEKVKHF
jgi:uncharacterized membrane protein required for colicin V production